MVDENQNTLKKRYPIGRNIKVKTMIKNFVKSIMLKSILVYKGFEP